MALTNSEILFKISKKPERTIIGLMSGTSLDGLDVALCNFKYSGVDTEIKLEKFKTVPYSSQIKDKIQSVFCKERVDFQELCILNAWIGTLHAEMVQSCLKEWRILPTEVDIIASHGQTVYHCPKSLHQIEDMPNATLQIGDGDHIAVKTGILTVSDFRQKHVAAGGEGAPLAFYFDYLIFSKQGENRIMLNIGGISNISCLYGNLNPSKGFATDLGPGNTLIDAFVRKNFAQEYDVDGKIAKNGKVNQALLTALKRHSFFALPFPKTTGPELFNLKYLDEAQVNSSTTEIDLTDVVASLTRFTAEVICDGIHRVSQDELFLKIYASGGGVHNRVLFQHLLNLLPHPVEIQLTDALGIPGDAKEAVLFATLANETLAGRKTDFGSRSTIPSVSMGKISFPE